MTQEPEVDDQPIVGLNYVQKDLARGCANQALGPIFQNDWNAGSRNRGGSGKHGSFVALGIDPDQPDIVKPNNLLSDQ